MFPSDTDTEALSQPDFDFYIIYFDQLNLELCERLTLPGSTPFFKNQKHCF